MGRLKCPSKSHPLGERAIRPGPHTLQVVSLTVVVTLAGCWPLAGRSSCPPTAVGSWLGSDEDRQSPATSPADVAPPVDLAPVARERAAVPGEGLSRTRSLQTRETFAPLHKKTFLFLASGEVPRHGFSLRPAEGRSADKPKLLSSL